MNSCISGTNANNLFGSGAIAPTQTQNVTTAIQQENAPPKAEKQQSRVVSSGAIACALPDDPSLDKLNSFLPTIAAYMNGQGGSLSINVNAVLPSGCNQGLVALSGNQALVKQHLNALVSRFISPDSA